MRRWCEVVWRLDKRELHVVTQEHTAKEAASISQKERELLLCVRIWGKISVCPKFWAIWLQNCQLNLDPQVGQEHT